MKHLFSSSLAALLVILLVLPAQAQEDVAQGWMMTPKMGQAAAFEAALAAHTQWRKDHNDPWNWTVMEFTTGEDVGSFLARSGGHTWGDFDEYGNWEHAEAAGMHFQTTVAPHLEELRSTITIGDPDRTYWPEDPSEAQVMMVVGVHVNPGKMPQYMEVVAAYHNTIVENNFDAHHYFAVNASGSEHDAYLVFPGASMADFADPEYTVNQLMTEKHGEKKFKEIQEMANGAIQDAENWMLVVRQDLSININTPN